MTWKVLEGHAEKEAMKKITDDQQESLNKWKSKGGHGNSLFFLVILPHLYIFSFQHTKFLINILSHVFNSRWQI